MSGIWMVTRSPEGYVGDERMQKHACMLSLLFITDSYSFPTKNALRFPLVLFVSLVGKTPSHPYPPSRPHFATLALNSLFPPIPIQVSCFNPHPSPLSLFFLTLTYKLQFSSKSQTRTGLTRDTLPPTLHILNITSQ